MRIFIIGNDDVTKRRMKNYYDILIKLYYYYALVIPSEL